MYRGYVKYKAKRTEYNGKVYASKFEAGVAEQLDSRMAAGEFTSVEPQFRIPLYCYKAGGETLALFAYVCDFRCERPDGTYLLVEAKGFKTDIYKIKRKVLEGIWLVDHPEYQFEEITELNNASVKRDGRKEK